MKESYSKFINLIIAIVLGSASQFIADTAMQNLFLGGSFAAGITAFTNWFSWGLENRSLLRTLVQALFVRKLRLSCSYLYKIEVEDKYLLVQSRKHKKYQPVGGNFKRNKYSNSFLNKIKAEPDDKFTNGDKSKEDLRFYIRGYRLARFIRWYNQANKEREVSYDREFFEELIEPGILLNKLFPYPIINFRKQVITKVKYSDHLKCKEVHFYDIVELNPTIEQLNYLKNLSTSNMNESCKWVKADVIKNQGYQSNLQETPFPITDHSAEILI